MLLLHCTVSLYYDCWPSSPPWGSYVKFLQEAYLELLTKELKGKIPQSNASQARHRGAVNNKVCPSSKGSPSSEALCERALKGNPASTCVSERAAGAYPLRINFRPRDHAQIDRTFDTTECHEVPIGLSPSLRCQAYSQNNGQDEILSERWVAEFPVI